VYAYLIRKIILNQCRQVAYFSDEPYNFIEL
jgi:hypothetical protein